MGGDSIHWQAHRHSHAVESALLAAAPAHGTSYGIVVDYGGHGIGTAMVMTRSAWLARAASVRQLQTILGRRYASNGG